MAAPERGVRIIPQEIITEILYRLPAKSVGRFRCVSKGWLSLLTDPQFIKTHKNNTLNNQHHLIFKTQTSNSKGSLFLHSYPFHYREVVTTPTKLNLQLNYNIAYGFDRLRICGSCDGLVLVRVIHDYRETLVVINPTTREFLQLPEDYFNLDDTNNIEYIQTDYVYGFGYDSVADDYKVVSLTYYYYLTGDEEQSDGVYVSVYSLRNKTWKRVTDSDSPNCYSRLFSVFVNGFIHWIVTNDDALTVIAAFSLADECFSEVLFPNVTTMWKRYDCQLVVLGGKLAIFIRSEGEVWLMNEYGVRESWTKILLHGIDKVPMYKPKPYIEPLAFDDNGKILVADGDRMMVYDVEKATFTETVCVWNPEMFSIAGFYVESLVSPKLGEGIGVEP